MGISAIFVIQYQHKKKRRMKGSMSTPMCVNCVRSSSSTNHALNIQGRSFTFSCECCEFDLHYECMLLPQSTRHRFDYKHPLVLKYPPHAYHENAFDCAECEKEIHPNFWLFHREECDLSFHTKCINDKLGRYKFGQKLEIESHPHPLKFVSKAAVDSPCHRCRDDIHLDLAFECQTCNFHLCRRCVTNIELMDQEKSEKISTT